MNPLLYSWVWLTFILALPTSALFCIDSWGIGGTSQIIVSQTQLSDQVDNIVCLYSVSNASKGGGGS